MIHKHIFVHAKPGMSEQEFFTYWREVHAERYGKKIKQDRGYLINTRVPFEGDGGDPPFQGVAEVWFASPADELAFAQSEEYLQGSRLDEPNFLAWWAMVSLDTTDHVVVAPPAGEWPGVKLFALAKRKAGLSLDEFRRYDREVYGPKVARLPGLRGYVQGHVADGHYAVGESLLDSVWQLWFDSVEATYAAIPNSDVFRDAVLPDLATFVDLRFFRTLLTEEHWVTRLEAGE